MALRYASALEGSDDAHTHLLQEKKRSFFVIVGDRQKDVIVNLYHVLLNVDVKLNKSILWTYKHKLLGFTRCDGLRQFMRHCC
jgi:tRNA(Met) C34 N-acetyltransferase TmcA